jgi:hypothetical protein
MIGRDEDTESSIGSYEDADEHVGAAVSFVRRTTLPPSYEQSDCNAQPTPMHGGGAGEHQRFDNAITPRAQHKSGMSSLSADAHVDETFS